MGRPTVSKEQRRETQQRAQNTNQDRLHRAHNAEVTEDATHEVKKLDPTLPVNTILRPLAPKSPLNLVSSSTPVPNFSTSAANSPHSFISSNSPSNVTSPIPPLNSSFPTPPPEPHNITSTNFPPPPHPLPQIHSPTATFVPREDVFNTKADQDRERKLAANRERQRLYRARAKEKKKQHLLEEKEREERGFGANKSIACSHCGDDDEFGKSEETTQEVEWANVIDGLMAMVTFFMAVIWVPVGLALWTIWGWRWKVVPGIGGMYLRSSA